MSEPTQITADSAFDPITFGIEVQDLATSVLATPEGQRLNSRQMRSAEKIATILATHRDQALKEFISAGMGSDELLDIDVNAQRDFTLSSEERIRIENTKRELQPVAQEMDHNEATRQVIGDWLGTLPTSKRRTLDTNTVLESLFAYDLEKLAFKDVDYDLAEGVMNAEAKIELRKQRLERALEDPSSTQIAATFIMEKLHSNPDKPTTKVSLRTSEEFRHMMQDQFHGISRTMIDTLFHSGWSYIETYFKDVDPTYELFTKDSRQKGTTYKLNNPGLVYELWQEEHGTPTEMAAEAAETAPINEVKTKQVTYFDGKVIRYANGTEIQLDSPVALAFKKKVEKRDERSEGAWISRIATAQEIAQELGLKKEDVEAELKQIISQAGPEAIKAAYSRRGNRVLIARGRLWKH